jgi:molecular chaperone GrpE
MILGGKKIKISTGNNEAAEGTIPHNEHPVDGPERDADFSKLESDPAVEEGDGSLGGEEGESGVTAELATLKAEVAEHKDKYLRALADFENYKKRALKERSELIKYQGERVIGDFLEVLDTLELALNHAESDPKKLSEGLKLIHKMFVDTLGRWEVRPGKAQGDKPDGRSEHEAGYRRR